MKLTIIGFLLVTVIGGLLLLQAPKAVAVNDECRHENAECQINAEGDNCCGGFTCQDFNQESGNGKCKPLVTPSVTPTPTGEVTATPSATPTITPEVTTVPTDGPNNPGGPGDGKSDGRSDGRSSCPSCTQAPTTNSPFDGSKVGWK